MKPVALIGSMLLGLISLSACQTVGHLGQKPFVYMGPATIKTYHAYRVAIANYPHHHMVFAYDPATEHSVWLGRKRRLGVGFATQEAIRNCKKYDPSTQCRILDIDGEIVWSDLNEDLKKRLTTFPKINFQPERIPYSEQKLTITSSQLQRYEEYHNRTLPHDSSAFYIANDGVSTGVAYNTGRKSDSRSNVLRDAAIRCQINSGGRPCYLFAVDGKPINDDARKVVK